MSDFLLKKLRERNRPSITYHIELEDTNIDLVLSISSKEKELERVYTKTLVDPKDDALKKRHTQLKKDITKLQKELASKRVTLKFQAVAPETYEALEEKYQRYKELKSEELTEEERADITKKRDKEFVSELLAASSMEPEMSFEYVKDELFPSLSRGEQMDILTKVHELNVRLPSTADVGNVNALIRGMR